MTAEQGPAPVGTMWALEMRNAEFGMRYAEPSDNSAFRIPRSAFQGVGEEEASALVAATGFADPAPVLKRFAAGSRCYAIRIDGVLASYGWVSFGQEWISELGLHIRLAPRDAYIWECVTLPAYRGQGLYSALLAYILQELRTEGLQRAWIGADTGNLASQKGIIRAGFQPIADFYPTPAESAHPFIITGRPGAPEDLVRDIQRAFLS